MIVCPTGGQLVPVRVLAAAVWFRHVEVVETQHAASAAGLVEARWQRVVSRTIPPCASLLRHQRHARTGRRYSERPVKASFMCLVEGTLGLPLMQS